ncbi:MAG: anti-sigma factor family protein [Lacisediminihabitans sp.]
MNDYPDQFRDWDAAYVLGALSPEDRRAFERHLASCPVCTAAVTELAGMPGLLRKLRAEDAVALTTAPDDDHLRGQQHEPGLVQKLAASANKRRRRVRAATLTLVLSAAAVLALGGIFIGAALGPTANIAEPPATSRPSGTVVAMTPLEPGTMTANLKFTQKPWGTRFDWTCEYLTGDGKTSGAKTYSMVITDASGIETIIATWNAAGPGAAGLAASSSVATSNIRSVEIRAMDTNTPLVRTDL